MKVAQFIKYVITTHRGAALRLLVTVVDLCIIPLAIYGSEIWWPDLSRTTPKGCVTPPTSAQCDMIDRVILTGLRAALPVLRTTPTPVVH